MPPLIAFAGALGGLAVVRWAYKTAVRINQELEEARSRASPRPPRPARNPDACAATPSPGAYRARATDQRA